MRDEVAAPGSEVDHPMSTAVHGLDPGSVRDQPSVEATMTTPRSSLARIASVGSVTVAILVGITATAVGRPDGLAPEPAASADGSHLAELTALQPTQVASPQPTPGGAWGHLSELSALEPRQVAGAEPTPPGTATSSTVWSHLRELTAMGPSEEVDPSLVAVSDR
jgi:hypothetical protein